MIGGGGDAMRYGTRVCFVAMTAGALSVIAAARDDVFKGAAAFGDWKQDKPGVRRAITAQDVPAPSTTSSARNDPRRVPMPEGARPSVPDGFTVEMVASGIRNPRNARIAPNGDLFVADSAAGAIRVYRLKPGSAIPVETGTFAAAGLNRPYGIAFYPLGANPQWVYIANTDSLVRFPYKNGDLQATGPAQRLVENVPSSHHWTRDVIVSPDGRRLFFSVGSGSNVGEDVTAPAPANWVGTHPLGEDWGAEAGRAEVRSYDPEGKDEKTVATGLRNCTGMAIQPGTNALWCSVQERDEIGDNLPFDYATTVREGQFYGWPWYYIGSHEDPRRRNERPDLKGKVTVPDVLFQAHSAVMNIAFYDADAFGPEYKGNAFVTMHGSWNRSARTGYKVVRVLFANGKPTGEYDDFMTGFVVSDQTVWGRPVGVAVARDGSLIVTEDGSGTIWRVSRSK
jgi:glucose/arabinose dehydrogenase